MGRRTAISMKMVLPTVSWVAVMRLLKKAPSEILGVDAAAKALLGCSALPATQSLRFTDAGSSGARRPKPASRAALLGCASSPLTDSFRVHHVVNQEALQLVLDECQANPSELILYNPYECEESLNCSFDMIIRDGDRLLHDVDASASVMSTCSSRLSNCTAGSCSTVFSTARTAFSRSSVDSDQEGHCSMTPGNIPAQSCCSSPISYFQTPDFSAAIDCSADCTDSLSCDSAEAHSFAQADDSSDAQSNADIACTHHVQDACHAYEANDEDVLHDDDDGMIVQTCYSADPMVDFQVSIEEMVLCHQLIGQTDELHRLYCRYIQLNPRSLHPTIALAFFHTLQRLNSCSC